MSFYLTKTKRDILIVLCVAIWVFGMFQLPNDVLTDYYHYKHGDSYTYDRINPTIGYIYISPGFFAFVGFVFSIIFNNRVAPQMTLAFYIAISMSFFALSLVQTEFLISGFCLIVATSIAALLIKTNSAIKLKL